MQVVIRKYRPSDREPVCSLFSSGTLEHIKPCFINAMTGPLYIIITLALSAAGFLLGSVLGALVLPGIWVGIIYYCCHELYSSYVRVKLQTDMQDITRSFLSRPDDCFWVAEAEVGGTSQIIGMVAVAAKHSPEKRQAEMFRMIISPLAVLLANQNGGVKQGELSRLSISPSFRRKGLGSRLSQAVISFCKERGFSELVLQTRACRIAALDLYKNLGFHVALIEFETHTPFWITRLANDPVATMKKHLKSSKNT